MAQNLVLKARGLHSFKNSLSAVSEGSLEQALNIIIDRDDIIEPRRGITQYTGVFADQIKQLLNYKNRLLAHQGTTLSFETSTLDGTFDDFSGSFTEVEAGRRIRAIEANGNLYFTTDNGVQKISASSASDFTTTSGYIRAAGGIKALDVQVTVDTNTPGFLTELSKVAYRVVWGMTDSNDNLILGSPSSRTIAENKDDTNTAIVTLSFPVPSLVDTNSFFYQVYRTTVVQAATINDLDALDPGDEMNLVFEEFILAGSITSFTAANPSVVTSTNHGLSDGDEITITGSTSGNIDGVKIVSNVTTNTFEVTNPSVLGGTAGSWIQSRITTTDITPDDFRANGAPLYTNPVSGQGIVQANEPPPFAKDIELYKGYLFYANTSTRQQLNLSMLSIVDLVSHVSELNVDDGITTRTYTFVGDYESFPVNFTGTTSANCDGNYFTIISAMDETKYKVWFDDTGTTLEPTLAGYASIKVDLTAVVDTPAAIGNATIAAILLATNDFNIPGSGASFSIECANNGAVATLVADTIGGAFTISQDGNGEGEDADAFEIFLPKVPSATENGPSTAQQIDQASRSIVRVINEDSLGLVDVFYLSGANDIPGQMLFQNRDLTGDAFFIYADAQTTGADFNPSLGVVSVNENKVTSSNEVRPNRLYYSKFQQPDAVPLVNYLDVGPRDQEIQRIVALRDSLFIFKQDGIYRLSGDVAPFSIAPFDFSLTLQAPDTAVVLNNQVHAFTSQGVVQVTDTGVSVISRNIEDLLLRVTRSGFAFATASFAVSYETDRSYLLFTVTESTDTVATQCFRYNSFTNTWVIWDLSKTCGLVNRRDNKLYLGAADTDIIEQERKNLDRTDYADRQFDSSIIADGVNEEFITLPNIDDIEIGDALVQTQYLTISQFNRTLKQLDTDPYTEPGATVIGSSATFGTPTVITSIAHGLFTGDLLYIRNSTTTPSIDGKSTITVIDDDTFSIDDSVTTASGILDYGKGYFSDLGAVPGSNLRTSVDDLANKLDVDTGVDDSDYAASITGVNTFVATQSDFNIIINKLNADIGVFFANYDLSTGTMNIESVVIAFPDNPPNTVEVNFAFPFIQGELIHYKAIDTQLIYDPQLMGDPSVFKQVSEGTFLFENNNFTSAAVGYKSDLSPSIEQISFNGSGIGDWGQFNWGEMNWGGISSAKPLRTLIPRQKQRCRFIQPQFTHKIAFEKWSLLGISLTSRPYSIRAYK